MALVPALIDIEGGAPTWLVLLVGVVVIAVVVVGLVVHAVRFLKSRQSKGAN